MERNIDNSFNIWPNSFKIVLISCLLDEILLGNGYFLPDIYSQDIFPLEKYLGRYFLCPMIFPA